MTLFKFSLIFGSDFVASIFVLPDRMMTCPALCSGKGECDTQTGKCSCFDPSDTSEGCYNSLPLSPSSIVHNEWNEFLKSSSSSNVFGTSNTKKWFLSLILLNIFVVL